MRVFVSESFRCRKKSKDCLKIIVLDDETIYLRLFEALIPKTSKMSSFIQIQTFTSATLAIEEIAKSNIDLVFIDIDLSNIDWDGFKVSKTLRINGYKNKICIHSNRNPFENKSLFNDAKADIMIPKPLSLFHMLNLLLATVSDEKT